MELVAISSIYQWSWRNWGPVVEPYFPTVVLFGGLIARAGSEAQQAEWLPRIIGGEVLGAFAYVERQSRFALNDCQTTAIKTGDGYVLNGEKVVVFNGEQADHLVVLARTSGEQSDRDGLSLFLVDAAADWRRQDGLPMMDGQRSPITLKDVSVGADALLGDEGGALAVVDALTDEAVIALAGGRRYHGRAECENAGVHKTREQFGVAIGSYQALQHRMVDTMMAYEQE